MKALIVFVFMVLAYSMINMGQKQVSASTYQVGVDAYMNQTQVKRGPAIELNKKK